MRKFCLMLLCSVLLCGCSQAKTPEPEPTSTPSATPISTQKPTSLKEEYPEMKNDEFLKDTTSQELVDVLNKGTGVVFLSFPECPWCHHFLPLLEEAAEKAHIDSVYYYNIREDRLNETPAYHKIVSLLDKHLDFDNDGNPRIYVPDVSVIKDGEIIYHTNETSQLNSKEISPDEYWTDEKKAETIAELTKAMKNLNEN